MTDKVKVSCMNCGATNNFPLDSAGKKVVCGRCKYSLPKPGETVEPTSEQSLILIKKSNLPLLIDFYSPTCAPCHIMHPIVESLARRRAGEIVAMKVNVDQNHQLAASFGIQAVPTFVILYKGNERGRTSGAVSETNFSFWVASIV